MNSTRFFIRLGYIFLSVLLFACHTTPPDGDPLGAIPVDSVREILETQTLADRTKMIGYGRLGIVYIARGQHDSARIYLNRALSLPGGREYEGGRLITNLANSYGFDGQYVEALKYYMEALYVSEQPATSEKDRGEKELNIIRVMANLSEIYYLMDNHEQALYYAGQARDRTKTETYITPQYLYVIGSCHFDAGELNEAQKAMQETYETAYRMISAGDLALYWYAAYGKEGLARISLARKEYGKALAHAAEALRFAELHNAPPVTAKILMTFSDIYLAQGDYQLSGKYAQDALKTFPEYLKVNPDAAFNVASASLFADNSEEAYEHFRLYSAQMKENTDKHFRETMAGMEVVYMTEKKEARIASLESQRLLYMSLSLTGILFIVALWMFFHQKIRQQRKEKQLVAAEAILEWEKKERKRFASDLHDGINGMLSAMKRELGKEESLQSIRDQIDDCIETIRRISRGMMPGSLEYYGLKAALEDYCRLFPNVYFHFFGKDKRIGERLELTVYYCAYELVNNSFRHSGAKNIHVQLVQDGDSVSLTVQDDGCGFDERNTAKGSGLRNIYDRVSTFNGKIDMTTSPGEGTEINIELNTWKTHNTRWYDKYIYCRRPHISG